MAGAGHCARGAAAAFVAAWIAYARRERANQAAEAITREAALQPQVPDTPPKPVIEACPASEAAGYMQQVEAIDAAYQTALERGNVTPESLTILAGEMETVAEEAMAWGCSGVAAEAQRRAQDIAEAARYAQEAQFMQEWVPSPGLHLHLPDFFGARVEGTIELGPLMVDINADLLFFPKQANWPSFFPIRLLYSTQADVVGWRRGEHDERYRMGRGENAGGLCRFCLGARGAYAADGAPCR